VTVILLLAVVLSESCQVAGQIFFKHAMSGNAGISARRVSGLTAGVFAMTVGFFLWLGLLQRFELSYIYPFEGIQRIILVAAATVFLKERMTRELWLGVILIMIGTALVSSS
jgi:uncharacterized membrane protein